MDLIHLMNNLIRQQNELETNGTKTDPNALEKHWFELYTATGHYVGTVQYIEQFHEAAWKLNVETETEVSVGDKVTIEHKMVEVAITPYTVSFYVGYPELQEHERETNKILALVNMQGNQMLTDATDLTGEVINSKAFVMFTTAGGIYTPIEDKPGFYTGLYDAEVEFELAMHQLPVFFVPADHIMDISDYIDQQGNRISTTEIRRSEPGSQQYHKIIISDELRAQRKEQYDLGIAAGAPADALEPLLEDPDVWVHSAIFIIGKQVSEPVPNEPADLV